MKVEAKTPARAFYRLPKSRPPLQRVPQDFENIRVVEEPVQPFRAEAEAEREHVFGGVHAADRFARDGFIRLRDLRAGGRKSCDRIVDSATVIRTPRPDIIEGLPGC